MHDGEMGIPIDHLLPGGLPPTGVTMMPYILALRAYLKRPYPPYRGSGDDVSVKVCTSDYWIGGSIPHAPVGCRAL